MATILNPTLHFPQDIGGGTLSFKVTYTVLFQTDEVHLEFDDATKLWEDDSGFLGSDDDPLTAYPNPDRFTAVERVVDREHIIFVPRTTANTEIGGEEFKAQIWLRRVGAGPATAEVYTNIVEADV
jgi:hypothetical protein